MWIIFMLEDIPCKISEIVDWEAEMIDNAFSYIKGLCKKKHSKLKKK